MHHVPVPHFDPGFSVHRPKVPGYDQYQGPSNYNQGLSNYNQGPSNYNQGPSNYNQGPYNQAGIFNNQLNGCSSSPCFNGAYCQSTGQYSFTCQCRSNYYGVRCERFRK